MDKLEEWVALIQQAIDMGITVEEIREYLNERKEENG